MGYDLKQFIYPSIGLIVWLVLFYLVIRSGGYHDSLPKRPVLDSIYYSGINFAIQRSFNLLAAAVHLSTLNLYVIDVHTSPMNTG